MDNISKLFYQLLDEGYIAEQDFMCCQSCGGAALSKQLKEENAKGYVFYHQQDTEMLERENKVYLSYSDIETAKAVIEIAKKLNIKTQWDGSERKRILVYNN